MWIDHRRYGSDSLDLDLDEAAVEQYLLDHAESLVYEVMTNSWLTVVGFLASRDEDLKFWLEARYSGEEE